MGKTIAKVYEIPNCDFCDKPAGYDAKTVFGPWAFLCSKHFMLHTNGALGVGVGQMLVLDK